MVYSKYGIYKHKYGVLKFPSVFFKGLAPMSIERYRRVCDGRCP